jgi:hypothetical protein
MTTPLLLLTLLSWEGVVQTTLQFQSLNRYVVVITALLLPQKLPVLRGGNNDLYNTIHITCIGRE